MRSLIRNRAQSTQPHDPAPSRLDYRMQRLMLTPGFRGMVRVGVPLLLIAVIGGSWYAKPDNRAQLSATVENAQREFQERPQFLVHGTRIEAGDAQIVAAVTAFLPSDYPLSSFDLDLDALRAEIEALEPVKDATLRIGPEGLLEVALTPRIPVAVWRDNETLRLLDGDGVVSGRLAVRSERPDLPLIAGDGAKAEIAEALVLFATSGPLLTRVRGLVRMGERRWDLVLDRDQRILLPSDGAAAALERVLALDAAQDLLARDIAVVDMRNGNRPTIRMNDAAVIALRRVGTGNQNNNNEVGN